MSINLKDSFSIETVNVMRTELLKRRKEASDYKQLHWESCKENKNLAKELARCREMKI